MKKISVSAPGKLMLFGEHSVIYDQPCIVTAVDHRIRVDVELIRHNQIEIEAPDVDIKLYKKSVSNLGKEENIPKGVRFLETAIKNFYKKYKINSGLRIKTKSEFSSKFGFGSSSAVTVAVLKALSIMFKKKISNKELFNLSYKTVLDVQGVGSGFDLAAAIWGGNIYFVKAGKTIKPLKTNQLSLVVGYTGIKADTPTLVRQVAQLKNKFPKITSQILQQ